MLRVALGFGLVALFLPTSARAQETSNCELLPDPNRTVNITNRGSPAETWFVTDAVFVCEGQRRIVATNATYYVGGGQFILDGNVQVDEPGRSLRSGFAQYYSETRQLHAHTNVVMRDTRSGSVITSQLLDLYEQSPDRPETLIVATGGTPRALLFQDREGGGRDSTIIDAQEIRIFGEQSFRATVDAVMRRDSLTASGRTIDYAEQARRLDVAGTAVVQTPAQTLRGDSVTATVAADDAIETVLARHAASLDTDDLNVTAPAIRLLFEDGGVSRLVAMMWDAARGADTASARRPRVVSEEFRLEADSIDVLAPQQQLSAAVAIGDAAGERILPDSLRALLPDAPDDVLALIAGDWMRGDTVRARFVPNPRAETDTTAAATIMEQLAALGDPAQSMYGMRDERDPHAMLSFNYLLARYIEVNFADGQVATVAASGDARGVYLQPGEAAAAVRAGGRVGAVTNGGGRR
jgi:lipopolysaccharide export system protein LptA